MSSIKEDTRRLLEWQRALGGVFLPLNEPSIEEVEPAASVRKVPNRPPAQNPTTTLSEAAPPAEGLFSTPIAQSTQPMSPYDRIKALIPLGSPLLGLNTLEEISRFVAENVLLPIDEVRLNPVPGAGNPNADLMVIGEAPGADEDKKGEPFVGRAGQLLTQILAAIQFQREDVFIANILKSRPPNNRDPLPEEIEAHIPILHRQITLIRPKLILCLGRVAAQSLLGTRAPLGKLRGVFQDYHGLEVLATYHPAALLRNPNWKRPTWEDVQLLRKRYDELTSTT